MLLAKSNGKEIVEEEEIETKHDHVSYNLPYRE